MSFRSTVYSLSTALLLLGCDSGQKNDQLLQAKLDAERVKELQTQNQELKNEKTELEKENGALKTELAAVRTQLTEAQRAANRVATRPAPEKKPQQRSSEKQNTSRPTKKDIEAVREQATGGGSFK